ncbi:hypothetical protein DITRI_Ditri01bG0149300 [Diplodiscus trichospermus]
MSPYLFATASWFLGCFLYGLGTWSFFRIVVECWALYLNRFHNHGADDTESGFDIELGITHRANVVPAVWESCLPIAGPKTQISAAADECAICLEGLQDKEICWVLVKCDHVFHKPCAEEWLKINPSCPLCRKDACFIIIDA